MADITHDTHLEALRSLPSSASITAPRRTVSGVLRDLIELTKPRITMMAVIVAGGAMLLAPGSLPLTHALLALVGIAMAVAGAGALNMVLEHDVDVLMERTRARPVASGRLSPVWGALVGAGLSGASLPLLYVVGGPLTCALTLFSLFVYVLVYTPMKRTSPWALLVGAVPGAMPALMGSSAVSDALDPVGTALFVFVLLWQVPHFLAIAIYREHEYVAAGHKVVPTVAGMRASKILMVASAVALAASGVALTPLGVTGVAVGVLAFLLGAGFVALCARGLWLRRRSDDDVWARVVFRASLVYQTLLFAALGAERLIDGGLVQAAVRIAGGAA